ncbi:MAG: enoyl-CoA hydratase-related protein [Actinomycetota bacterium]
MTEPVLLEEDLGPVRRLTLNRPELLNALSTELVDALSAALTRAAADDGARVVVVRGAGRAFCAGYDLKEEAEQHAEHGVPDQAGWREELAASVEHMLELFDHPKPVIAEVHGYCLAGGCDLMMICDLAVSSDDALFGEPEIRFGSGVVTMVMPWLIGARKAKELLFTGEDRIPADQALGMGLVNRVVPRDRLEDETLALGRKIAVLDPVAVSLTKRSINRAWDAAGFRQALQANVDLDAVIESAEVPERQEFNRIRAEQGLKAAIAWRDARFR